MADPYASIREEYRKSAYPDVHDDFTTWEEMLPCRDGVRLRTIFYRPVTDEPVPTIVQRCCYPGQEGMIRVHGEEVCKKGFALVCQMCRGTGGSEGQWEPNVNERSDGLDLMQALDKLSWIDCMGYKGASYLALTGWAMADAVPSKVRSMYLTVYGTSRHTSAYKDGLFRQDILTAWAMSNAGFPVSADYLTSAAYRPQVQVDEALWGKRLDWYRDWITHTDADDPYWQQGFWGQLREIPSKVTFPVCIVEGWYDHHLGSALKGYESLSEQSKAHTVLRIGPWNHFFTPVIRGHVNQRNGNSRDTLDALDWFYETLMQKQLPKGRVEAYLIGSDTWQEFAQFPFAPEKEEVFYLSAAKEGNAYALMPEADESAEISYTYDPQNPVFSHGGESLFETREEIGSLPQPECGWRDDVISFVSAPLEHDMTILGPLKAQLYVASDAQDTAFTIKVMEVFDNGEAYNIRNGITTLAYRNGAQHRLPYEPNTVESLEIACWDVAWTLKKGSRLRVDISSSNFPEYSVHPNQAGVWSKIDKTVPAKQTLYIGLQHPACITLPLT